jgi:hypothetical protein
MTVWNNSKMTVYYPASESSEADCVVKIDEQEILVEYDDDGTLRQYRGLNRGDGHFSLEMHAPGTSGKASLHMFDGSTILEGYWCEDSYRGMWRIKLS